MKIIDCTNQALPLLAKVLNYMPSSYAQVIACLEDGAPIAGVIYDGYNGATIGAHIWIDEGKMPSKEWFAAIFDYPFNKLQVVKIIGQVKSSNIEAIKLDENLGFMLEGVIEDYYDDGSALLIYTMRKDQSKILNSYAWRKVVARVRGV